MKLTFSILKGYFFKSKFISIIFLLSTLSLGIIISSLTIYINYLEDNVINKTVNSLGVSNKNIWLNNTNASLSEDYLANKSELIEELVNQESGFITDNSKIIKLDISKNKSPLKNIIYKKNVSQHSSSIKDYSLSVVTIDNLFENVSILDSTDENKEGVFNIYISKNTSKMLDILVGDIIYIPDPLYPEPLKFHVSKIFDLDENDEFWMGQTSVVNPRVNANGILETPLSINSKDLLKLNERSEGSTSLYWMFFLSDNLIFDFGPSKSIEYIKNIQNQLSLKFPSSLIINPIAERLESNLNDYKNTLPSLLIIGSLLIMTSLIISLLPILQLGEKFNSEFYILKMRGLKGKQLFADIIFWLFLFVFPICLLGSFIGNYLTTYIIDSSEILNNESKNGFSVNFLSGILASFISIIAISIPIFIKRFLQNNSIENQKIFDKFRSSSFFQRYYIDLIIISLASVSFWESLISNFQYLANYSNDNIALIAILKMAIPMFWILGLIFLVLRLFQIINLITEKLRINVNKPLWLRFSLINVTRKPNEYSWILLIFWISTCTILSSRTIINTVDNHINDSLSYQVGGDIRINDVPLEKSLNKTEINIDVLSQYNQSLSFRGVGKLGKKDFKFLAVQPELIEKSIWYREDFSSKSISELMPKIQINNSQEKLFIKENIKSIGLTINNSTPIPSHVQLWLRVKFNNGRHETIPISNCKVFDCHQKNHPDINWSSYYINLDEEIKESIEIVGILVYETSPEDLSTEFTLKIKEINFSTNNNLNNSEGRFNYLGVIPINESNSWQTLPTSEGIDTNLNFYYLEGESDSEYMEINFGSGSDEGIRGIYLSSFNELPIITSKSFLKENLHQVGEKFIAKLGGHYVQLKIVDSLELFPTLDPSENGFIILDGDDLINFLEIRGPLRFNSTEIFASSKNNISTENFFSNSIESNQSDSKLNSSMLDFSVQENQQKYFIKDNLIESLKDNKVTEGGLDGLNILSLYIIPVLLVLGSISFVSIQVITRSSEWISSKRIGINSRIIFTHVILEYLIVIIVGILLGIFTSSFITKILVNELIEVFYSTSTLLYLPIYLKVNWSIYYSIIISAVIIVFLSSIIGIKNILKSISTEEQTFQ
ncbi:MAG: hypothetical protein CL905_02045 [Dehalococcoidia bacterium]|nr:hypothetical protein [Dehalococcoidia bacterium]